MKKFLALLCLALPALLTAQAAAPQMSKFTPSEAGQYHATSANGRFAVGHGFNESSYYSEPFLLDTSTGKFTNLYAARDKDTNGEAWAVTDDGSIVGGAWNCDAAIYRTTKGAWEKLPVPAGMTYQTGLVSSLTPDGKTAVGYFFTEVSNVGGQTAYLERPMMWDLSGSQPKIVELENIPDFNSEMGQADSVRFLEISADGNYILCLVDFTAPMTEWTFLYHVPTQTWKPLGLRYEGGKLLPGTGDIQMVEGGKFSPSGKYLALNALTEDDTCIALYDISKDEFAIVPESHGKMLGGVDDFGVVYASAPSTPLRNWGFYAKGYWYDWKMALSQIWGVDWAADFMKEEDATSGTFLSATADGLHLAAVNYALRPSPAFFITLDTPLYDLADSLDPLANHKVSPAAGSTFSLLRTLTVTFDRDIEIAGERNCVTLLDSDDSEAASSISFALQAGETRTVAITFRNAELEAGHTYNVVIPAGAIRIKGDASRTNKEIRIAYNGRANQPVAASRIVPEPGTAMPRLSLSTNPITVTFDAAVLPVDGGSISLSRLNGSEYEAVTGMGFTIDGQEVTIYPLGDVELAKDMTYKVSINPGTFSDIAGGNPNELIEFTYLGTFEPENNWEDGIIYKEDFDLGLSKLMLFDGDQQTPVATMADWGFTYEWPWWYVRDSEDSMDQSACSHSMYTPSGKSDDWMVTPRMYIPDSECRLTFQSQSYKKGMADRLKVYVYATDAIYTAPINAATIDLFRKNAVLVYDEVQDPGRREETLAGDWRDNTVSLAPYAGKHIYIAFVNDNEAQSAIFIDNVVVERDLTFTMSFSMPENLVDAASVPVKGQLRSMTAEPIEGVSMRLLTPSGAEISTYSSAQTLQKDEALDFAFPQELPLEKGVVNEFTVEVTVGGRTVPFTGSVGNLMFKPRRNIVVEEATGSKCGFCPLGHRALDLLDEMYGDQIIPVAIHSYSGGSDFLTDWTSAYGAFLGLSGAPTAAINRLEVGGPLWTDEKDYYLNDPQNQSTWFDIIGRQLSQIPEGEITIGHAYIDTEKGLVEVDASMRYALDADNVNLNLHTVVLENSLSAVQSNNVYYINSELLGPWGAGGQYGKANVRYGYDHVARGMHGNSFAGVAGLFPRTLKSSQTYQNIYTFPIPYYLTNPENAEVVVMLIDANSGKIINAARQPLELNTASLDKVDTPEPQTGDVYSIYGIRVLQGATLQDIFRLEKGIYIFQGRKVLVK